MKRLTSVLIVLMILSRSSREERGWIADFLFEHGIRFDYEHVYRWNGQPYRPDFTLFGPPPSYSKIAVIEHWGVSQHEPDDAALFADGKTVGTYRREMQAKRAFWAGRSEIFIETSLDNMRQGRQAFEARLKAKLEAAGIRCVRLPEAELQQKVERRYWDELTGQILQFIQRAKNRRTSPAEARRVWRTMRRGSTRTRLFWGLAARVYGVYEELLATQNQMDFQDLLAEAAERIEAEQGNIAFVPERGKLPVRLPDLRMLLIDEYQDFSPGFDHLIATMRKYNPHLRLFCVGDDWQTINRFAGSEPVYFRGFTQRLDKAAQALLKINHRSQKAIVAVSNRLMDGHGVPGAWLPHQRGGVVYAYCIDQLWLESIEPANNGANDNDRRAEPEKRTYDPGFMRARCLAACRAIISHSLKLGQSAAILSAPVGSTT